jgi:molecular chaperone DnaK (HSP70)
MASTLKMVHCFCTDWPFKVISKDGKPVISVEYRGETKEFTPQEISSMVLLKMKETAEAYLGKTVANAGKPSLPHYSICITHHPYSHLLLLS